MRSEPLVRRAGKAAVLALIAGTVGGAAVIAAEAVAARTRRYAQPDMRLAMRTSIGDPAAAPLRLVLLGDASALGGGGAAAAGRGLIRGRGHLSRPRCGRGVLPAAAPGAGLLRSPARPGPGPGGTGGRRGTRGPGRTGRTGVPRRRRYPLPRRAAPLGRRVPGLGPRAVPRGGRGGRRRITLRHARRRYRRHRPLADRAGRQ